MGLDLTYTVHVCGVNPERLAPKELDNLTQTVDRWLHASEARTVISRSVSSSSRPNAWRRGREHPTDT